ncbi:cupin domain-containing protein [Sphingomonas nostoxanthinifaciens]|uniref:cupin domain-containing protein n=1 Tax=Sphingomonas nostoxanthinifaciens TaxID=2872652 RepID=UPI001CC2036D|nr:quercetin 2,3-dioxygenase family protein [Sphingomonas nostoxanthinifaciens]UAK22863.1 quercetin 2,3-dioxygenase family protein [Sphingomonas nostoxanthinifaciens]
MTDQTTLPGLEPYILRAGEGISHLVANQIVRTLAGVEQTAGGFGAVVCDCPLDRFPVPMHWHEREHDTWFVTRGKLQVWCNDGSRILSPGDFAYVKPRDTHSYQSVAPRSQFFGIVAPGGWEQFFADAGEVWGMTALPPSDRPINFPKLGAAIAKHGIMRVDEAVYGPATPIGEGDQALPGEHRSFFLEASFGPRGTLAGHLVTSVLTAAETNGMVEMRVVEGGRDAAMPTMHHAATHVFLYVLDGLVELTLDGEGLRLTSGDAANIPAGTPYATRIASGSARWIVASANGDGTSFWSRAAADAPTYSHPMTVDRDADLARLRALTDIDVVIA